MQNGSWHKTNVNQPSHDNSQTYNIMFKVLPTIPWKTCCNVANLFPTSHRNFCLPKEIKQREEEQQKCRAHLDKCLWHPLASVYNRDYPMDFGSGMIIWFEFTLHDSVILYIVFMCNIWPNQWPTFKCVLKFHFIVLRLSKIYLLCTPSCWVLILTSRVEPVFFSGCLALMFNCLLIIKKPYLTNTFWKTTVKHAHWNACDVVWRDGSNVRELP